MVRLELRAGDQWPVEAKNGISVERTMIQATTKLYGATSEPLPLSREVWWAFSFLLEPGAAFTGLAPGYDWLIFADIHSDWNASHARAVPIQFELRPDDFVTIEIHGTKLFPNNAPHLVYRSEQPLQRGIWHDMVVRLVMDPLNRIGGHADAYMDGAQVLRYLGPLGFIGDLPYAQYQIYRDSPDPHRIHHEVVSIRYANHQIVTSGRLWDRVGSPPSVPRSP